MKVMIVGLGSMGKRRARLLKGILPDVCLLGVDSAPARRAEAEDRAREEIIGWLSAAIETSCRRQADSVRNAA